jgi:hypothetical protein
MAPGDVGSTQAAVVVKPQFGHDSSNTCLQGASDSQPISEWHVRKRYDHGWLLDPCEVQRTAAECGPFTVDACALSSSSAQAVKFYSSKNAFSQANVQGESVWLNVPFRRLGPYLRHYLDCKQQSPHNTSACIVVPRWLNKEWWYLLDGMLQIRHYNAGTVCFMAQDDKGNCALVGAPWDVNVLYDPLCQGWILRLRLISAVH